jgi:hypothetical protein
MSYQKVSGAAFRVRLKFDFGVTQAHRQLRSPARLGEGKDPAPLPEQRQPQEDPPGWSVRAQAIDRCPSCRGSLIQNTAKNLNVAASCDVQKLPLVIAILAGRDKAVPLLNESGNTVKFVGYRRRRKKEASRPSSRL